MIIKNRHAVAAQCSGVPSMRCLGARSVLPSILLLVLSALSSLAWSATPHSFPKSCGTPGGVACPPPPPSVTGWTYTIDFGMNYGWQPPPFHSDPEVIQYHHTYYTAVGHLCADTYTNTTSPSTAWGATPAYQFGILTRDSYVIHFAENGYNYPPNACSQNWTNDGNVLKSRDVYCPKPQTLIYQANPPIGPYCGSPAPPTPPQPNLFKQIGTPCPGGCSSGSTGDSGAADAGSARTVKGNPVDVSNGNKFERQVDYRGSGTNPIEFARSYNSLAGYLLYNTVAGKQFLSPSPMGAAWSGSYFQYLTPVSTNNGAAVYAVRPDGRVLVFTQYLGVYSPEGDVADSLAQTATGGWQYQTADDAIETYDASGRLLSVAERGKAPITVSYAVDSGPGDPPVSVSDAFGHSLQFSYLPDSTQVLRLATISTPDGHQIQYTYDTSGNLATVVQTDGTSLSFDYGASPGRHQLTTLTDESSVQFASWTYGNNGAQVSTSQHAGGVEQYSFSYATSGAGGSVTVTDPLNKQRTYNQQLIWGVYRSAGSSALCPGCAEDAGRTFDGNGNIVTRTDFSGNVTQYSYDVTTNLETSRTEAYGTPRARTITTAWNPSWRQPDLITEPNRTTSFTYDGNGNTLTRTITDTTVTPNVSRTWTYTYDSYGRVWTADGPRTDVSDLTIYTYYTCTTGYECGQVHTITNAANQVTTYNTYNAHGQPLTITDPNGIVTTLTYDARQRLKTRTTANETTALDYWPTGLLQKVTLPDASSLTYTYDGAHRLTQITDALGNKTVYVLDAMGNRTAENTYDPANTLHRTHTRVINTLNQLWKDVNAAGTAAVTTIFGYDPQGNQTSVAAPLSRNTTNAYDELNRLKQITDPANGVTQFGYDANDNLTSVTDPRGLATGYVYNGFGDLNTQTSPDTGTTTNTYDSAGNLATSTDARGAVSTYTYDTLNRVSTVAYSRSGTTDQTIAFTYDAGANGKGHLTGASDANHSLAWSYDALGRVAGKSQTVGSVSQSVGYAYTNGNLTTVTTPSGQSVTYGYNGNHQVTSVAVNGTTVLNSVTYEPLGPVSGWAWGNETTTTRTYDTDGKISQITSAGTKTYSYDDAFRITSLTDTSPGASHWTYGYDSLDRLTSGTSPSVTRGWTYDANGNRLTETGSAPSTYTVSPSSNRISGITGALARTYAYDAAGNTTGYSTVTASYNNAGRLQTLTNGGSTETAFYNALGQRIRISGGASGTVLYAYDETGHLLGEYDGTGTLIEETVWLGDIPVATLRPNGSTVAIYYVHSDQLNTPRQVTRASDNTVMWTWTSDPFGTDAANPNPSGAGTFAYNLRFAGQVFDGQAGLHDNYFRDYDPAIGRYIESDPILRPSRDVIDGEWVFAVPLAIRKIRLLLPYAYVADQPIVGSDPRGLFWPLDFIHCLYYSNKYLNAAQDCRRRSGSCSQEQINFMTAYQSGSMTGAVLHCACLNAGPGVCQNMFESCGKTGTGAPKMVE